MLWTVDITFHLTMEKDKLKEYFIPTKKYGIGIGRPKVNFQENNSTLE